MKKSVKKIWIKALRSGEYEQGRGFLCRQYAEEKPKYCCLGVLANEALDDYWVEEDAWQGTITWSIGGSTSYFREKNMDALGLCKFNQVKLTNMNDLEELSFSAIADWIEENL